MGRLLDTEIDYVAALGPRNIEHAWIEELPERVDESVLLRGWVAKKRSSGKIGFVQLRDGSAVVQVVISSVEVLNKAPDFSR